MGARLWSTLSVVHSGKHVKISPLLRNTSRPSCTVYNLTKNTQGQSLQMCSNSWEIRFHIMTFVDQPCLIKRAFIFKCDTNQTDPEAC